VASERVPRLCGRSVSESNGLLSAHSFVEHVINCVGLSSDYIGLLGDQYSISSTVDRPSCRFLFCRSNAVVGSFDDRRKDDG